MKLKFTLILMAISAISFAQTPLYYQSNYLRIVQPNDNGKLDTLINPYTGGINNPVFFSINLNGDNIQDLFVFDRDVAENQFLNFTAVRKKSTSYYFTPKYESFFPKDIAFWVGITDYNKDGLKDIFTHSPTNSTGIKVYKNTSYTDAVTKKYMLQFKAVRDTLYTYDAQNSPKPIDVPTASNPVFVDVDKDGFMDILSYDINLNAIQFYRNEGKYKDSLNFYYNDRCWGKFEESGKHLYTPWNCLEYNVYDPKHKTSTAHGYGSICAYDVDGDGDMDLLMGDGGNDSLAMLLNGKTTNKNHRDTITNISFKYNDNNYPQDVAAVIHTMPTPSILDINNDGLADLIVSAGQPTDTETFHSPRINNVWYYQNNGDSVTPVFILQQKDFLQNTMVDWGVNSAPCFIDVDKDGRKDMIVAVRDGGGKNGYSHLILYLNKAGAKPGSKPYMLFQTSDYLGLGGLSVPIIRPIPSPYMNGSDKKTDLIVGNDSGHVMYFKDRSTGNNAADFHLAQSSLKYILNGKLTSIDVGYNSSPTSADINKDGKTDLLIGSNDGRISYYRCLGYGPSPDFVPYFQLVTNNFGGINAIPGTDYQSAPCVADLNMNGKPDLLVGDRYGRLFYYPDFDTTSNNMQPVQNSLVFEYVTNTRSTGKLFSTWLVPAVANLDQDTIPDIMLGCRRGGLFFLGSYNNDFETIKSGIEPDKLTQLSGLKLYPNPAKDHFILEYNNGSEAVNANLYVTDMMGRRLINITLKMEPGKGATSVNTGDLKNGIYIVTLIAGDQYLSTDKIIINK